MKDQSVIISKNVRSSDLTTFRIGGIIESLAEPQNLEGLSSFLRSCSHSNINYRILGAGSNLLIPDKAITAEVIIRLGGDFESWEILNEDLDGAVVVQAGAAVPIMSLSRKLSQQGICGLEFASGIPGSVGGIVAMNAGAHGEMVQDVIESITLFSRDRGVEIITNPEFAYRKFLNLNGRIITSARFKLKRGDPALSQKRRAECLQYRKQTQPLHLPSAGSIFRNPSNTSSPGASSVTVGEYSAGELIEKVGLKGRANGGVQFSELHSNWIVKIEENAKASEVLELIQTAQDEVKTSFGIELHPELVIW